MFTIGPFSRIAGVSAKVLRSYDLVGLFRPVWTDPWSGYRYYSPAQLPDVRRILSLRAERIADKRDDSEHRQPQPRLDIGHVAEARVEILQQDRDAHEQQGDDDCHAVFQSKPGASTGHLISPAYGCMVEPAVPDWVDNPQQENRSFTWR